MKIKYDKEADAMYIEVREGLSYKTEKVDENTLMDYDKDGNLIGIEFLFVKKNNPDLLKNISGQEVIVI